MVGSSRTSLGSICRSRASGDARAEDRLDHGDAGSTRPYRSVSCGVIIHTRSAATSAEERDSLRCVHVEGDPDHPINRGTLCPEGHHAARTTSPARSGLTTPQVRRPGLGQVGADLLGRGDQRDRAARSRRRATAASSRQEREGRDGEPQPGHGMIGGCTDTNEFNFSCSGRPSPSWGVVLPRYAGKSLTRVPRWAQSGRHVRAAGDDQLAGSTSRTPT